MNDRTDPSGGGLTGATGDLTPDGSDEPFVPAERREQAAYRMEVHPPGGQATEPDDDAPPEVPATPPRAGVDEIADHEERF